MTFDTGVMVALDKDNREAWTALKTYVRSGRIPTIPTVVVAQAWRDGTRQARLAKALKHCRAEALDEGAARAVGELCGRAGTADVVDAAVVVGAFRRRDVVLTGDARELELLASYLPARGVVVVGLG
ncbi:MAG TPA: hypothetical protein VM264_12295 [Acidimicrobiales bacterium]|nr:hypothetical protein [Acidimicrobiales bacterium]